MSAFVWAWAWIAGAQPAPDEAAPEPIEASAEAGEEPLDEAPVDAAEPVEPEAAPEVAPVAKAAPVPTSGPPMFVGGDNVEVPTVPGDVFAMARTLKIKGEVPDNAFLLGQTVIIDEAIRGDAIALGQTVRIQAPVWGDVYVVGGEVRLNAPVYGTVYTAGNRIVLNDEVFGVVEASAREIVLQGHLHDEANLQFANVEVDGSARVDGDLNYIAPRKNAAFADVTEGQVKFTLGEFDVDIDRNDPMSILQDILGRLLGAVYNYVGLLAVGFVMLAFAGGFVRGPSRALLEQPVMSAALGAAAAVAIPIVATVAALLFVTLPLSVVMIAMYTTGLFVVQLFTATALGRLFNARFLPGLADNDFASMAIGLIPLVLLYANPFWISAVVYALATIVGFGALWLFWRDEARDRRRARKSQKA